MDTNRGFLSTYPNRPDTIYQLAWLPVGARSKKADNSDTCVSPARKPFDRIPQHGSWHPPEQAWRALRDTQEALRVSFTEDDPDILEDDDEGVDNNQLPAGELVSVLETGDSEAAAGQRLIFGQKLDSFIRKRSARTPSWQGSLFDGI